MKLSLSRLEDRPEVDTTPWLDGNVTNKLSGVAATLGRSQHTVELIVVDDDFIQKINRDYRGSDGPTDVLSFTYLDDADPRVAGDDLAGEIYVSYETLEQEAKRQGVEPANLFLRLGVHGLLHVLGFDHKTDHDTKRMEGKERRLLREHLSSQEVDELFQ